MPGCELQPRSCPSGDCTPSSAPLCCPRTTTPHRRHLTTGESRKLHRAPLSASSRRSPPSAVRISSASAAMRPSSPIAPATPPASGCRSSASLASRRAAWPSNAPATLRGWRERAQSNMLLARQAAAPRPPKWDSSHLPL